MKFEFEPIGFVAAMRPHAEDDFWAGEESCITLADAFKADAVAGLDAFSHVEVLFLFHQVKPVDIVWGTRHPRNNDGWPAVGIFAQRARNRPNRLGSTICKIVRLQENRLYVSDLDAIDGTPVLDLKPVMAEFLPREPLRQPAWSHELMQQYWLKRR